MKKILNILCGMFIMLLAVSCSEELLVDETLDNVSSGAVLRNLGITNNLDSADLSSTYSIVLEAQDAQGGRLLSEVRVNVGFNDINDEGTDTVAVSLFSTILASAFNETSPTTNGLPVATFTVTLGELVTHVGTSSGNYSVGDDFVIDFEMELTDGRIFNLSNATQDVTRTGAFSYFNAQFRYSATVKDPNRLTVTDIDVSGESSGQLRQNTIDTVFVTFDRSESDIITFPTITSVSALGNTDDNIGAFTLWDDEDNDDDLIYFFLYTAGAAAADTIDFVIQDGISVAGFPSYTKRLKKAFVIDNAIAASLISESTIEDDEIASLALTFDFGEELAGDSIMFSVDAGGQFDNFMVKQKVEEGDESSVLTFTPRLGDLRLALQNLTFDVTLTGAKDVAGNEVDQTISVDIL